MLQGNSFMRHALQGDAVVVKFEKWLLKSERPGWVVRASTKAMDFPKGLGKVPVQILSVFMPLFLTPFRRLQARPQLVRRIIPSRNPSALEV